MRQDKSHSLNIHKRIDFSCANSNALCFGNMDGIYRGGVSARKKTAPGVWSIHEKGGGIQILTG